MQIPEIIKEQIQIDDRDRDLLDQYEWRYQEKTNSIYFLEKRFKENKTLYSVYLARKIVARGIGESNIYQCSVRHKDGDKLNFKRENLLVIGRTVNSQIDRLIQSWRKQEKVVKKKKETTLDDWTLDLGLEMKNTLKRYAELTGKTQQELTVAALERYLREGVDV